MTIEKQDSKREGRIIEVPLTQEEIFENDMWLFRLREMRKKGELPENNENEENIEEDIAVEEES